MTNEKLFTPVSPVEPAAPWLGGKIRLAPTIVPIIDQTEHTTYAEPFIGMGGIFLRRQLRSHAECINDKSGDVVTLFRILQLHYQQFLDVLKWQITSRAEFDKLSKTNPETLTDLQRAARFLYLQRLAFGGKTTGQSFGVSPSAPARFDLTKLVPMLEDVHERLAGVVIECLDYTVFIERYDTPDTLFYLDPPYFNCENDYGKNLFDRSQFDIMAAQLASIDGKFLLSINDVPEIRAAFKKYNILDVQTNYSIGAKTDREKNRKELIISNFEPQKSGLLL